AEWQECDLVADGEPPALDAADRDPAEEGREVERGDQHLERTVRIARWGRHVLEDRIEERLQRRSRLVELERGRARAARRVEEGAIELLLRRLEVEEEREHLVVHAQRLGVAAIDL